MKKFQKTIDIRANRTLQIANRLIKFAELDTANGGELLSNLKLQKLLYYEQGFHLALFNSQVYERYKSYSAIGLMDLILGELRG